MEHSFTNDQKQEIKSLVHEAIAEYFSTKSKSAKAILIAAATIVGSLTVIFGGFKVVLGWLGFTLINK